MTRMQILEMALEATAVEGSTGFVWFGKRPPAISAGVRKAISRRARRDYLIESLADCLYSNFYSQGCAMPAEWQGAHAGPPVDRTPQLMAAAPGGGRWEGGWTVADTSSNRLRVERDGLILTLFPHEFRPDDGWLPLTGTTGSVRLPGALCGMSPGFFMVLGDQPETSGAHQTVRVYWNIASSGIVALTAALTSHLNAAGVPFRFKVLKTASASRRCDAAVLYVGVDHVEQALAIAARVRQEIGAVLRPLTPVFTKRLVPGIGLAEQPDAEPSFGSHRCGLVAHAILSAHERGQSSLADRCRSVVDAFERAGLRFDAPHLNPGSSQTYKWPESRGTVISPGPMHSIGVVVPREANFLDASHRIGQRLADEALWYEDQCTWIATFPSDEASTSRSLGPELYSGTAGVGLFLGELAAVTGDGALANTARAAFRQSWHTIDSIKHAERLGLFTGWAGIAFAATRVARVLGDEQLLQLARELWRRLMQEGPSDGARDLIAGSAGAMLALLAMGDDAPAGGIDFATALADQLLQRAVGHAGAWSWPGFNDSHEYNLTGLSHGTAGIGLALAELWAVTGENRFRDAARRAFAYERDWFVPQARNWPDLRGIRRRHGRPRGPLPFSSFWCHGAAGIALSRIRAFELLGDEEYQREAQCGLDTVREWIVFMLETHTANFSLCHGLAGNAEVLRLGAEHSGGVRHGDLAIVAEVARVGLERHAAGAEDWPCAAGGGPAPSLMLGLAGIGHFYLRLGDRTTRPILLPGGRAVA